MLTFELLNKALLKGKRIEYLADDGLWYEKGGISFFKPISYYRIKPEPAKAVPKIEQLNPQHLGKNAKEGYKHNSKAKCLALATGYFYQENNEASWYWLFKYESGL